MHDFSKTRAVWLVPVYLRYPYFKELASLLKFYCCVCTLNTLSHELARHTFTFVPSFLRKSKRIIQVHHNDKMHQYSGTAGSANTDWCVVPDLGGSTTH